MTTPTAFFVSVCFVGGLAVSGWMTIADHGLTGFVFAILTMIVVMVMIASSHDQVTQDKIKNSLKEEDE